MRLLQISGGGNARRAPQRPGSNLTGPVAVEGQRYIEVTIELPRLSIDPWPDWPGGH